MDAAPHGLRGALLVDVEPVAPGAMLKADFLGELKQAVTAATDAEMGAVGTSDGCPYIAAYFAKYTAQPASAVETLLGKWLPQSRAARSAQGLIPLVVARVKEGVRTWQATGGLPADLAAADPALANHVASSAPGATAAPGSLSAMEQQLGPGQGLDGATTSRMSSAVGADVSGARIHQGATASTLAAQHDATAFAVGQNVVLGSGAPTPGTMEGDILLAHELAHTAQQREAASDPHLRRKPIGPEDDAAERDAGAERLGKLANLSGQIGDVMKTGLQLQRCPNKPLDGPPMEGKQADAALATIPMIQERIFSDVKAGITAEATTHFHETKESFAQAWYEDSVLIRSMFNPKLSPEQMDKVRWQEARKLADNGGGFTNYQRHIIHIYTKNSPAFVTIHELIHLHTKENVYGLGSNFVEGVADYYTDIACKKNKIPFEATYSDQIKAIRELAAAMGEDPLANVVFNGDLDAGRAVLDSKGPGTWKKYFAALNASDYGAASKVLKGVAEANGKRVAAEHAKSEADNAAAKKAEDAELAQSRKGWPPEGTKPVEGGVLKADVVDGRGRASIARGGLDGVREGWLARGKLADGSSFTSKVVTVRERWSQIDLPTLEAAQTIVGKVELRPPQAP